MELANINEQCLWFNEELPRMVAMNGGYEVTQLRQLCNELANGRGWVTGIY